MLALEAYGLHIPGAAIDRAAVDAGIDAGPLPIDGIGPGTEPIVVFLGDDVVDLARWAGVPVVALDGRPLAWLADETRADEWLPILTPAGRTAWMQTGAAAWPDGGCDPPPDATPPIDGVRSITCWTDRDRCLEAVEIARAIAPDAFTPSTEVAAGLGTRLPADRPLRVDRAERPGVRHGRAGRLGRGGHGAGVRDGAPTPVRDLPRGGGARRGAVDARARVAPGWRAARPGPGRRACAGHGLCRRGAARHPARLAVGSPGGLGRDRRTSPGPPATRRCSCPSCGSSDRTARSSLVPATRCGSPVRSAASRAAASSRAPCSGRRPDNREPAPDPARYAAAVSLRPDLVECWLFRVTPAAPGDPRPDARPPGAAAHPPRAAPDLSRACGSA